MVLKGSLQMILPTNAELNCLLSAIPAIEREKYLKIFLVKTTEILQSSANNSKGRLNLHRLYTLSHDDDDDDEMNMVTCDSFLLYRVIINFYNYAINLLIYLLIINI
jgi:K+-sensing histidine kinase KdpD